MDNLLKKYREEVVPALMKELSLGRMEVPVITKIVVNMGLGREATANSQAIDKAQEQLTALTGQKALVTKARKAIASFKLREGQPVGVCVTLRGLRMWVFLDKLINIVLPRTRDFQGVPTDSFDAQGNYALGITEHTLFPEIDISKVDKVRGLQVVMTIKAKEKEHTYLLLEKLGMPFKKGKE
jgi:large subunit ribosomal protein L5